MAIIPQQTFFSPEDVLSDLGDLKRLQVVLENLPDEQLVRTLERERGKTGRDDYPVRMMWNLMIAGIVFQHTTITGLLRELSRNHQLRWVVSGGQMTSSSIPSEDAMSRFQKRLTKHQDLVDTMFDEIVQKLRDYFPALGERLAIDSKMIESAACRRSQSATSGGRGEHEAEYGKKSYRGKHQDGTTWEKTTTYFGYKVHLLVDSSYEIPLAYQMTTARPHDLPIGKELVQHYAKSQPALYQTCRILTADRGYDSVSFASTLAEDGITAVIDTRMLWKEAEKPLMDYDNLTYNENGEVRCCCPVSGTVRVMSNRGYEASRDCVRKQCPVRVYRGMVCPGQAQCPASRGIRIPCSTNKRVFTRIPRDSKKWKRLYKARTSVERVNSRLETSYGFQQHGIRGWKKMRLRVSLALLVMATKTLAHMKRTDSNSTNYNSLVKMPA
ncbi:MAG TPA: transposase [Clostridiaceae bacterium]|nr:transposase [Clostridiaceae bacterium]